ncbi:MAG: aldo/keto reductase, partial [Rhizobiaceae bacterium]|nr:aldo/keto reductase [Rhizobiaceae bacterium]
SYNSEDSVGKAVRASGLPRDDFFITTKVADTRLDKAQFLPSVRASLDTIGVDQVDLLLIHWPSHKDIVPFEDYVLALGEARDKGYARLIGVSNFPIALLERTRTLLGPDAIATNQVEIHPYLQTPKLVGYARSIGLTLTAYQPLAKGEVRDDPVLSKIGDRHGVTASAAALAFLMAEGHVVIPSSASEVNLRSNYAALGVSLDEDEMTAIRALNRGYRRINPDKSPQWDD